MVHVVRRIAVAVESDVASLDASGIHQAAFVGFDVFLVFADS